MESLRVRERLPKGRNPCDEDVFEDWDVFPVAWALNKVLTSKAGYESACVTVYKRISGGPMSMRHIFLRNLSLIQ